MERPGYCNRLPGKFIWIKWTAVVWCGDNHTPHCPLQSVCMTAPTDGATTWELERGETLFRRTPQWPLTTSNTWPGQDWAGQGCWRNCIPYPGKCINTARHMPCWCCYTLIIEGHIQYMYNVVPNTEREIIRIGNRILSQNKPPTNRGPLSKYH